MASSACASEGGGGSSDGGESAGADAATSSLADASSSEDESSASESGTAPPPATSGGPNGTSDGSTSSSESETGEDTAPPRGGPSEYCGAVLFTETFEDTNFEARGWYDAPAGVLSQAEAIAGSTSSLECRLAPGGIGCEGGAPRRRLFEGQTAMCLSYWVKYSADYIGSGLSWQPHEFWIMTNADDMFVGPGNSRLTTHVDHVGGTPRMALQDSLNVDPSCVLFNDDSFQGCNGDFESYVFTENRSAAACNGLVGDPGGRVCNANQFGFHSSRYWFSDTRAFGDAPPWDKNDWHQIHAYFRLNDIEDGIGVPNGIMRYWADGELLLALDEVLMRTGAYPDMRFNQLFVEPYMDAGSPVDQTMWVDDLEVSVGSD